MKHNVLAIWLKAAVIGTTLIGLAICIFVVPFAGEFLGKQYPEFSYCIMPWMIAVYVAAVPCFIAMGLCFKITDNIGKGNSFCRQNAKLFKIFSWLALGDSIFFFAVGIVYWLLGMNHPGLVLMDLLVVFIGMAIFACTSALSYFVAKAADLQEDNDLTI